MIFTSKISNSQWFRAPASSQKVTGGLSFNSFTDQAISDNFGKTRNAYLDGSNPPTQITCDIEVIDNDFTTGRADLKLDKYTVRSGLEWTPGGSLALSATALAAAIDNLPEFSASAIGAVITVLGPTGPHKLEFSVLYRGSKTNFTMTPNSGYMTPGEPVMDGPEITTP